MKARNIFYWTVTALFAAMIILASVPDVIRADEAIAVFGRLGYPTYLLPFLGVAKLLGIIAILAPWSGRLKEWAYAGLVFDLLGALYSHLSVGDPPSVWIFAVIGLMLLTASYVLQCEAPVVRTRAVV